MRRATPAICIAFLLGMTWVFPLFRILPLDAGTTDAEVAFDAAAFAQEFWEERLSASTSNADDVLSVLRILATDADAARRQFGRSQGVSRGFFLYLRGNGQVTAIDKKGLTIDLEPADNSQIMLQTGPIFGNILRDATGLFAAGDTVTSQQLNDVSSKLNQLVEQQVVTELADQAAVDRRIEFVGCAEVKDPKRLSMPLRVIPIAFEWTGGED